MDKASELKIAADKAARHVSEVAPELSAEESKMLQDILELPLMFPIVKNNDTKEVKENTDS
jgi:hypothetical protein